MERLLELVDPAITRLDELIAQTEFPSTAYAAARDVLDRTGYGAEQKIRHSGAIGRPDPNENFGAMLARFEVLLAKAKARDEDEPTDTEPTTH
ncbi:MAG: hypothetical protein ABR606_05030 [Vicinamibacterales bacterium]